MYRAGAAWADVELYDALPLPAASETFDVVSCMFALHHVPRERQPGVAQMRRSSSTVGQHGAPGRHHSRADAAVRSSRDAHRRVLHEPGCPAVTIVLRSG